MAAATSTAPGTGATVPPARPPRPTVASPRRRASDVLVTAVLAVVAVLFAVPLLWLVIASLDPAASLQLSLPEEPGLDNFAAVLTVDTTLRPLLNSLVLCLSASLITVLVATLAAYPLSRYQLRYGRPFLYTILFATGLPLTAVMVPVYSLFARMDLVDTRYGTVLFLAATSLPIAIWLTKSFMDGVPIQLEEAAWTDGASAMQSLRSIVAPLMLPGMLVVGIFTFITAWGNFFVPFVLLLSEEKLPAAVTIYQFFGQYGAAAYGQLAAYSLLYTLPVVVLYAVVSRWLGGAFTLGGGVKG
ncbi:carbohydrate ABC transporter permease [uncultured Pseudokineococcus sp.]|uniref:carbohydrate ABC transporter permease n=1 Tax=uncultured Pseudokineococcus sp. TaxID=1642928 RepID=UPI0026114CCF|nr:carbohydrate ABC transporter permease [uncultured Pseudokineococcus sp.]